MRKYHYPLYDAATQDDAGTLKITAESVEEADEKAFAWQRANAGYDVDILRARAEIMPMPELGEVELQERFRAQLNRKPTQSLKAGGHAFTLSNG